MSSRISFTALLCALAYATPLAGQASARGQVRLVIRPVLHLETASTEAQRVESESGVEVRGAVRVRVSANAPWRLVVRSRAGGVSEPGSGGSGPGVWVRATAGATGFARSLASGYTPMAAGVVEVAEGEPGADQEVILDYRLARGEPLGPELGPEDLVVELTER